MPGRRKLAATVSIGAVVALLVPLGALPSATAATARARHGRRDGGSLTVLESFLSWTSGLDPQTNPQAVADQSLEDAVYGELFELGPRGRIVDDLASGAHLGDGGRTLTIDVRRGVRFSDGMPFTSTAVADNLRADLKAECACRPSWPVSSITTPSTDEVVVHLRHPDGAILDQFQGSIANWVVDPRALGQMGVVAYGQRPVGAGPFEVVSDVTNDKLVLRRNPRYWQRGHPYLKELTFQAITLPTQAIEDLRNAEAVSGLHSGVGEALESMSSPGLLSGFTSDGCRATLEPSTSVLYVGLDLARAPFDRPKARRALYEATDATALDRVLNGNAVPVVESFTGPTGRFYEPRVPGYPTYDLHKARQLVHRLGGLSFTLVVPYYLGQTLGAALQSMYDEAGMKVTLATSLSKGWGAVVGSLGSFDPAGPSGLQRFEKVPVLGRLLAAGAAATGSSARARDYAKAAEVFTKDELGPFLYPPASWSIACHGAEGPGLTSELPAIGPGPAIPWEDVFVKG